MMRSELHLICAGTFPPSLWVPNCVGSTTVAMEILLPALSTYSLHSSISLPISCVDHVVPFQQMTGSNIAYIDSFGDYLEILVCGMTKSTFKGQRKEERTVRGDRWDIISACIIKV